MMLLLAAVDWTNVLDSLIAVIPAVVAAVYAGKIHRAIRTPSGDPLGHVVERAHDTGIANNLLLSQATKQTKQATPEELHAAEANGPSIPVTDPGRRD